MSNQGGSLTPAEIINRARDDIAWYEQIAGTTDDEWLEAIARISRQNAETLQALAGQMGQQQTAPQSAQADSSLVVGMAGKALEAIPQNQTGQAVFEKNGTRRTFTIEAGNEVERGDVVKVVNSEGEAVPVTENKGKEIVFDSPNEAVQGQRFKFHESDIVSVDPGEEEKIIEVNVGGGEVHAVGTTPDEDATYRYSAGNSDIGPGADSLEGNHYQAPLGTPNDRHTFSKPLIVSGSFSVFVQLSNSPNSAKQFVNKTLVYEG